MLRNQHTEADVRPSRRVASPQERYGQLRGCACNLRDEKYFQRPTDKTYRWLVLHRRSREPN